MNSVDLVNALKVQSATLSHSEESDDARQTVMVGALAITLMVQWARNHRALRVLVRRRTRRGDQENNREKLVCTIMSGQHEDERT